MNYRQALAHAKALARKRYLLPPAVPFPNLTCEQRTAPCSNDIPANGPKRSLPADAKTFPIGHLHKQGLQLITEGDRTDLQYFGGKKA